MRTLTVDDNPQVVNVSLRYLRQLDPTGLHLSAHNASGALALLEKGPVDVVFLDIEMPGMSGLDVARQLRQTSPQTNIVFVTGYTDYLQPAFELYASGYLLKPLSLAKMEEALENLRYPPKARDDGASHTNPVIEVRCFGQFEVFCDGRPMRFERQKSKELLAVLVDRRGAMVDIDTALGCLWPDEVPSVALKHRLRSAVGGLAHALDKAGVPQALVRRRGLVGIDTSYVGCDYYRWLDCRDDVETSSPIGEYMMGYEFASDTRQALWAHGVRK